MNTARAKVAGTTDRGAAAAVSAAHGGDDGEAYGAGMKLLDVGHPGELTDEEDSDGATQENATALTCQHTVRAVRAAGAHMTSTSITPNVPPMCAQATFGDFRRKFVAWAVSLNKMVLSPHHFGSGETFGDTFVPSVYAAATVDPKLLGPAYAAKIGHSLWLPGAPPQPPPRPDGPPPRRSAPQRCVGPPSDLLRG